MGSPDPTDDGFIDDTGACKQTGACEIADYCYDIGPAGAAEQHGGVWVQSYWSVADGGCRVPQERIVPGATSGCPSLIQGPAQRCSPRNWDRSTRFP